MAAAAMISNLLHNLNPSSRRGPPNISVGPDAVTEEIYTKHLLFPDTTTIYHSDGQTYPLPETFTPGSTYDGAHGEIDLEYPRDIRIIIAQDEAGTIPSVLYDSKPGPTRAESPTQSATRSRILGAAGNAGTAGPTFGGNHARRSSLAIDSSTPRSPTIGAFQRARTRGSSISSMPNIDEHTQSRPKDPVVDEVSICLDCMFGNTAMSYRGNTNKLHIVPLDSRVSDTITSPVLQDATSSLGRAEGLRRRSHLAKSYTPSNIPPELPLPRQTTETADASPREPRRRTIFITRIFSVTLPEEDQCSDTSNIRTPTPQNSYGKGNGFPFPRTNSSKSAASRSTQATPARKTPMFGISIILHLPVSSTPARPASRFGPPRLPGLIPNLISGPESLASSLDSDRRAGGWALIDSNFGVESLLSNSLHSDVDDRVDVIGQHWDVITRTLTSLQFVIHERIVNYFKATEVSSPPILMAPRIQASRSGSRDTQMQMPPRRSLRLQPNALQFDQEVKNAIEFASDRVVRGMKIPRVITGQGKWGVWREEARWLGRWAGGKDENFFFFNLLTAFLGNHTEWLNILGPKMHRRRHREHQKSSAGEDTTITNRTIIVSPNKMAARRLLFLLAAFLPSSSSTMYDGASPMRPSTSASFRAYSQSPPSNMPVSRKQSLRRTINRRPRPKPSLTNVRGHTPAATSNSLPTADHSIERQDPAATSPPETSRHSRRSSAHSIRASLVIPSMSDSVTTKGSTATTSTITPENAVPVAHFTVPRGPSGQSPEKRPESSESLASANLMHTLQRSASSHTSNPSIDSQSTGRWGSMLSFWSGGRRESSTDHSEILQSTDDGLGISAAYMRPAERPRTALEQMVHEIELNPEFYAEDLESYDSSNVDEGTDNSPEQRPMGSSGVPASAARAIPERPKAHLSPLKLSVNEKDGVIDVDISLPEFGSPLQSPLLGGHSASSFEGSSLGQSSVFSFPHQEPDQPVNVAGWLKEFHPDFAVQAIKPYTDLERDVKRAMSGEPTPITTATTPTLEQGPLEKWIDVCSALIADTRSFTVKRIKLRRLVRLIPAPVYQQSALTPGLSGVPGRSQYGNPYTSGPTLPMTELHLDEKFIEEPVMDMDGTLVDAVERILAQSGQPSRAQSASSSRSSSRRGRKNTRSGSDVAPGLEIPRSECKTLILDALENVVKSVTAERDAKEQRNNETPTAGRKNADKDAMPKAASDSTLKEGIRRWLSEVE